MLIKEFSEAIGLSRDAIRFYEKRGLIRPQVHRGGNRYRHYTDADLERVRDIQLGQALGFTLREIKDGLDAWYQGKLSRSAKQKLIELKLAEVRGQIERLRKSERYLKKKLVWMRNGERGPAPEFG